jgi:hypothetical protein
MVLAFALALVAACGQVANRPTASPTASAPASSPSPTATVTPSPSGTASAVPTPTPSQPAPPAGFTCASASGGSAQAVSRVVAVRVGSHDGYDRLVIEFSGAVPAYRIQLQTGTRFVTDPRGAPVTLAGSNGVLVDLRPVADWVNYAGPSAFQPGFQFLREARLIQNFEGVQQWGLGLQGSPCLRVFTLASPSRLVIDIASI